MNLMSRKRRVNKQRSYNDKKSDVETVKIDVVRNKQPKENMKRKKK